MTSSPQEHNKESKLLEIATFWAKIQPQELIASQILHFSTWTPPSHPLQARLGLLATPCHTLPRAKCTSKH